MTGTQDVCLHSGCGEPEHLRGWCSRHYRYRLHTGRYGYRDAGPARAHVQKLRALGWTYMQIAETAGTSTWVPHQLATGGVRNVWCESEQAILTVPLEPRDSHRGVDGTGTYRRLEGLQWMGWPLHLVGARLGLKPYTLTTLRSRGEPVSYRVALAMVDLYGELANRRGPSTQTATKARRRGYSPPAAWDDDTIDDPTAVADTGAAAADRRTVVVEEYRHLSALGVSTHEIAAKLGVTVRTLAVHVRGAA